MNIEILQDKTNETGNYKVWFTNPMGYKFCRIFSEETIFNLLTDKQMDQFLCGKTTFKVGRTHFHSMPFNS